MKVWACELVDTLMYGGKHESVGDRCVIGCSQAEHRDRREDAGGRHLDQTHLRRSRGMPTYSTALPCSFGPREEALHLLHVWNIRNKSEKVTCKISTHNQLLIILHQWYVMISYQKVNLRLHAKAAMLLFVKSIIFCSKRPKRLKTGRDCRPSCDILILHVLV